MTCIYALCSDSIIPGGAYDTVPEVCILLALIEGSDKILDIVFDEAGELLILATDYALCGS